jgi:hypothetical protein
VSETTHCPHCGGRAGLAPLYQEVRKIRELAEEAHAADADRADGDRRHIAELMREIEVLRATVARLRGTAVAGLSRTG